MATTKMGCAGCQIRKSTGFALSEFNSQDSQQLHRRNERADERHAAHRGVVAPEADAGLLAAEA